MSDAQQDEVLDAIGAIRKRPGMYVGDVTEGSGLHHLLWETVANALDEYLAGHARQLHVSFEGARVTVEDDGRGIPITKLPDGRTYLEKVKRARPWRTSSKIHASASRYLSSVSWRKVNSRQPG